MNERILFIPCCKILLMFYNLRISSTSKIIYNKTKTMKAIIEFELPEDQEEYEKANNANKMYMALWDIKQLFRSTLKYNPMGLKSKELEQWEAMRGKFFDILENNDLKFD